MNRFYIAIEKAAAKRTDFFISVSDAMTAQTKAAGIGADKPFITAHSAVEKDLFLKDFTDEQKNAFRKRYDIAADAVVQLTIARLIKLKGHDYIIESAKELSKRFDNCVWLFVGDGVYKDTLMRKVKAAGLQKQFRFAGLFSPEDIPPAIQSSDILVHCSLREAFGRILPQAMLCAKPAIAFDVDAVSEIISSDTGRLVEPKNITHLTAACAELIADAELRKTLGNNAKQTALKNFSTEKMVDIIESVYSKLLEESE